MNILNQTNSALLLGTITATIALAFVVYRNNPKSATNRIFGLLSVLISGWLVANYISIHPSFVSSSLFWIRMSIFFATPMSATLYLLTHTLPHESLQVGRQKLALLLFSMLIVMIVNISPYAFTGVEIVDHAVSPTPGFGLIPFVIFSTFFSIYAVYTLIKKFRRAIELEHRQLRLMIFGMASMLFLIIATVLVPSVLFRVSIFVSFIPLYTLIFLGMTAYAIVQHRLFNIRVITTDFFVSVIWIVLFSKIFTSLSLTEKVIDSLTLGLVIFFGILLIRSVRQEVEQREKLEILSKELARANDALKTLDQTKSEFISIAGHQLRAPLTVIKGYVSMTLGGSFGAITEKAKGALEKVFISAEQLVKLVGDMLNLSRIEAGRIQYEFKENDIVELTESVVGEYTPEAKKKGLKLVFKNELKKAFQFVFDRDKIREVIINLIHNSIKYSPRGAITVRLARSGEGPDAKMLLSVKDEGAGIKPEDISKLFIKFNRTEEVKVIDPNGMGIGLYFVKRVVEDHGGKAWAESEGLGKGSTFIVELPVKH